LNDGLNKSYITSLNEYLKLFMHNIRYKGGLVKPEVSIFVIDISIPWTSITSALPMSHYKGVKSYI